MRYFAQLKADPPVKLVIYFVVALLLGWTMMSSTGVAQSPRPTLTHTPTPTATPGPTSTPAPTLEAQTVTGYGGPNLKGRVINLETDAPVSGATVIFSTGGVDVETVTNEVGEYVFELGAANGLLNVVPPAGSGLKSVTADIALQPKKGVETVVNLGVSPNGSGAPPIIPKVSVSPSWVGAGEKMTITVFVKNTWPQAISGATVTQWLPDNLVPVRIDSSTGNPYFSANLAIAELGRLDPESGALIEIVAQAADNRGVTTASQSRVSFFFREDAAAQGRALGTSNGAAPTVLPVTGVGLPLIGLLLVVVLIVTGWLRRRVGRVTSFG